MNRYRLASQGSGLLGWFGLIFAAAPARAQTVGGYTIKTVAGILGFSFGYAGDGGPATQAQFWGLFNLTVDSAGNIYIADQFNDRDPQSQRRHHQYHRGRRTRRAITAIMAPPPDAEVNEPTGVAIDSKGNLYIADYNNQRHPQGDPAAAPSPRWPAIMAPGAGYSGDNAAAISAPTGPADYGGARFVEQYVHRRHHQQPHSQSDRRQRRHFVRPASTTTGGTTIFHELPGDYDARGFGPRRATRAMAASHRGAARYARGNLPWIPPATSTFPIAKTT